MRISTFYWVAGVIACGMNNFASGEILTFAMEGTVTVVENPTGALDFVMPGDRVVYTFTFDSNAPDQNPTPNVGEYSFLASTLSVEGQMVPSSPRGIHVGHPLDIFDVLSDITVPGLTNAFLRFTLNDQVESNALTDTSLPTVPYDLALFETSSFLIQGLGPVIPPDTYPSISSFSGLIDQFYIVPEPAAVLLICLGLLVVTRRSPNRGDILLFHASLRVSPAGFRAPARPQPGNRWTRARRVAAPRGWPLLSHAAFFKRRPNAGR